MVKNIETPPIQKESAINIPYNYRILIVDDDEACAKMLMWTLEELGQVAQIALDGPYAIKLAQALQPELILLDIGLPGMNGYDICKTLRQDFDSKALIVAQTGWGEEEHKIRSKAAGFDYHLVKPINVGALNSILLVLNQDRQKTERTNSLNI